MSKLNIKNNHVRYIILCIVLFPLYCFSQTDSLYIKPFDQELSIKPYVYKNFTSISHEVGNDEVMYMPNNPVSIGIGVTYKQYSLSGGYGFGFMRDKNMGKTKSLDFQYHYYGRKFVFDVFFQNYKGFYYEDEKKDEVYHIFPDIKLVQYGLFGLYVFNGKKFSYQAAFNQTERQVKSAGSFQIGGGLYYNHLRSDTLFSLDGGKLKNYQISLSGGYAYTWVIKKNYFVSMSVSVGINFGDRSLKSFGRKLEVSPSVFPRVSMGYNGSNWSVGLSFLANRIYASHTKDLKMSFNTGSFQLYYVKRFSVTPKFLKKIKYIN